MTEIATDAEIDIVWEDRQATVSIPLAEQASQEWCRRYQGLARRKNVPAQAENHPSRAWVVVELPDGAGRDEVTETLDAARDLIAATDAADEAPDTEETARLIRDWWAGQRG